MNIKERIRKMGPFIALVVTFIVIAALNDSFVDPNNLKNLLRQVSINALISFGMTFVILTGGIAHNKSVVEYISEFCSFIAPIAVYPGENELESLVANALVVLRGTIVPKVYA